MRAIAWRSSSSSRTAVSITTAARWGSATRKPLIALLAASLLGGCATPYREGAAANRQGRCDEAASRFEAALGDDPQRLDALIGLELSRYKLGDYDAAIEALERVVAQAPRHAAARLFLGLASLQRGEDGRADEHLAAFRDLRPDLRTAALVDRVLKLLRVDPLTTELRGFIAASLETALEWQREIRETRQALQDEELQRLSRERTIFVVPRCCGC